MAETVRKSIETNFKATTLNNFDVGAANKSFDASLLFKRGANAKVSGFYKGGGGGNFYKKRQHSASNKR